MKLSPRRKARELAFQTVYSWQMADLSVEQALEILEKRAEDENLNKDVVNYARILFTNTVNNFKKAVSLIKKNLENWSFKRLAAVDKAILLLATAELIERLNPPAVVINEAVELAKRFGNPDSGKFVNGILDRIKEQMVALKPGG